MVPPSPRKAGLPPSHEAMAGQVVDFATKDTRRHFIVAWHAEVRRKKTGPTL